jgi:NhaA family Na+:H+ antiporter
VSPLKRLFASEAGGGVALILAAVVALVWANSPWAESYTTLWHLPVGVSLGGRSFSLTLHQWINDGLMAVFFFQVGLEIKREFLVGELSSPRNAVLPIAAAFGGMVVPALIYSGINAGRPGIAGWGIPMATDIAFALGVLALLGPRVPAGLKVFLAALAIADDLGAVLVIALFYSTGIAWLWLAVGGIAIACAALGNVGGVRQPLFFVVLGCVAWIAFLHSGVHATVAGVLIAMTIPVRTRLEENEFVLEGRRLLTAFQQSSRGDVSVLGNPAQQEAVHRLETACKHVQTPLSRMEHSLAGVIAFGIMPVFALANAGVSLGGAEGAAGGLAVTLGALIGLVLGKPIGVTLFSWLAVRSGLAVLPAGTSWRALHGVSWLAGIGFTMSLFIAGLAFGESALLTDAKLGVFAASVIAGGIGWFLLRAQHAASMRSVST